MTKEFPIMELGIPYAKGEIIKENKDGSVIIKIISLLDENRTPKFVGLRVIITNTLKSKLSVLLTSVLGFIKHNGKNHELSTSVRVPTVVDEKHKASVLTTYGYTDKIDKSVKGPNTKDNCYQQRLSLVYRDKPLLPSDKTISENTFDAKASIPFINLVESLVKDIKIKSEDNIKEESTYINLMDIGESI